MCEDLLAQEPLGCGGGLCGGWRVFVPGRGHSKQESGGHTWVTWMTTGAWPRVPGMSSL